MPTPTPSPGARAPACRLLIDAPPVRALVQGGPYNCFAGRDASVAPQRYAPRRSVGAAMLRARARGRCRLDHEATRAPGHDEYGILFGPRQRERCDRADTTCSTSY